MNTWLSASCARLTVPLLGLCGGVSQSLVDLRSHRRLPAVPAPVCRHWAGSKGGACKPRHLLVALALVFASPVAAQQPSAPMMASWYMGGAFCHYRSKGLSLDAAVDASFRLTTARFPAAVRTEQFPLYAAIAMQEACPKALIR